MLRWSRAIVVNDELKGAAMTASDEIQKGERK